MNAPFISDASDSKILSFDMYNEQNARPHFLRLRLHALFGILFNRPIIIPEGWALDSLTYIKVSSEIATAYEKLNQPGILTDYPLNEFSPFVMEAKTGTQYFEILKKYAERGEGVRWGGLQPNIDKGDRRQFFSRKISEVPWEDGNRLDYENLANIYVSALGDETFARDISIVAKYHSQKSQTLMPVNVSKNEFRLSFNNQLRGLETFCKENETENSRDILNHLTNIRNSGIYFQTSSEAMAFAERHDQDPLLKQTFFQLANLIYMQLSADNTASHFSVPRFTYIDKNNADVISMIHNSILTNKFDETVPVGELSIEFGEGLSDNLKQRLLDETNWAIIWEKVIRLSHSNAWREQIKNCSALINRHSIEDIAGNLASIVEDEKFTKLQDLLHEFVPELVFVRSRMGELGLALKLPKLLQDVVEGQIEKGAGKLVENALVGIGGLVATTPLYMIHPAFAVVSTAFTVPLVKQAISNVAREDGAWASKSSIFGKK
jgi:hypothetical protein